MSQHGEGPPQTDEGPADEDPPLGTGPQVGSFGRRAAIKKAGVGAGVAVGLVWTSPRIEGLTLRPSYAQAASAPAGSDQSFVFDTNSTAPYAKAGAGPPAPHLAFGYSMPPPLPVDDAPPPTDDGSLFVRGPALGPLAFTPYLTASLYVALSTDCPATVDANWQDTATGTINRTDGATTSGPYDINRYTTFTLAPSRRAALLTFHFTC